jgi:hypothetical protein
MQNFSFEVEFNGFQECMEAAVIDGAMNAFESDRKRSLSYYNDDEPTEEQIWAPLPGRPDDETVSAIIAAVGGLSGKTFGNLRNELLAQKPIFPKPGYGREFCTPLFLLKEALNDCPPDFVQFKDLGLQFASTVAGVRYAGFQSEVVKMGVETRGFDFFHLLPTVEEIEASEATEEFGSPDEAATHFLTDANLYVRTAVVEARAAIDEGVCPPAPEELAANEQFTSASYEDSEWAEKREQYSELIAIVQAAWPLVKDVNPPGAPDEIVAMVNRGKEVAVKLLGLQ